MSVTKLPDKATHVGLVVPDIEKARKELLAIYGPLPGLDFVYDFFPDTVWGPDGNVIPGKCQLRICMIDWVDGMKMEVLQPILGATEHDRFLREVGGGLHHVAYYVKEGFTEYRKLLLDQGAHILFESETNDDRGYRRCCYLKLPESQMVFEIAEPPKPFPNQK